MVSKKRMKDKETGNKKGFRIPIIVLLVQFLITTFYVGAFAQDINSTKKNSTLCDENIAQISLQLALVTAISNEKIECVKEILGTGLNPNYKIGNSNFSSPILVAMVNGNVEITRELIKAGAIIKGDDGNAALMFASAKGYFEVAKMLLDAGADVNAKVAEDKSVPLMAASHQERENIVKLLLKSGVYVNAVTDEGLSSLMLSANNSNIVKALLNAGAKIDATDNKGWTALFYAVNDIHPEKIGILLEKGAIVNLKDKNGLTPLMLAKQIKDLTYRKKIIKLLKEFDAK